MRARSESSRFWLGSFAGYLRVGALLVGNVIALGLIVRHIAAYVGGVWSRVYMIMSAGCLATFACTGMQECMFRAPTGPCMHFPLRSESWRFS